MHHKNCLLAIFVLTSLTILFISNNKRKSHQIKKQFYNITSNDIRNFLVSRIKFKNSQAEQKMLSSDQDIPISNISFLYEKLVRGFWWRTAEDYLFAPMDRPEVTVDIPKLVHFIWYGEVIPQKYIDNIRSFTRHFDESSREYKVILWTDNNTLSLHTNIEGILLRDLYSLELINSETFKSEGLGSKGDILSYEIIYQFGGIYCDTDCISVKKYQQILQKSFVSYGVEITGYPYLIFHGIFGMAKGSNFMKFALDTIKLNYEKNPNYATRWAPAKTGPVFLTTIFVHFFDPKINMISGEYLIGKSNKSIIYQVRN